jgi:ADP-ribose pyrophosphatase YjhB (NUDIX family)
MSASPVVRLRGYAYQVFYRMPFKWRRRLVRLGSARFTVGAVILVRDPQDRIVLLRQPPGHGWGLPAGLLKRGETTSVGAARELFEETGLRVRAEQLEPLQPNAIVHTSGRWVDVVYTARVPADSVFTVDGGEVYEAAWHRIDALPPLTQASARLLGIYGIGPHAASAPDAEPEPEGGAVAASEPQPESAAEAGPERDAG